MDHLKFMQEAIKEAKKSGWWQKAYSIQVNHKMSPEMKKVLMSDKEAWRKDTNCWR